MARTTATRQEATDRAGTADVPRIGIDATGAKHYHDDEHDRVIVIDESGDIERVQGLDDRPVREWLAYVELDRGGWSELTFTQEALTGVVRRLGEE